MQNYIQSKLYAAELICGSCTFVISAYKGVGVVHTGAMNGKPI